MRQFKEPGLMDYGGRNQGQLPVHEDGATRAEYRLYVKNGLFSSESAGNVIFTGVSLSRGGRGGGALGARVPLQTKG